MEPETPLPAYIALDAWALEQKIRRDEFLRPLAVQLHRITVSYFTRQKVALYDRLLKKEMSVQEGILREALKEDIEPVLDTIFGEFKPQFTRDLNRILNEVQKGAAQHRSSDFGYQLQFVLEHPKAREALQQYCANQVTRINENTRKTIKNIIIKGEKENKSYAEMAKSIADKFKEFADPRPQKHIRNRAELVTTYELGTAYEAASESVSATLAIKGIPMKKRWLTVGDARVDQECKGNEAVGWIEFNATFPTGHSRALAHPACRCTTLFEMDEAAAHRILGDPVEEPGEEYVPPVHTAPFPGSRHPWAKYPPKPRTQRPTSQTRHAPSVPHPWAIGTGYRAIVNGKATFIDGKGRKNPGSKIPTSDDLALLPHLDSKSPTPPVFPNNTAYDGGNKPYLVNVTAPIMPGANAPAPKPPGGTTVKPPAPVAPTVPTIKKPEYPAGYRTGPDRTLAKGERTDPKIEDAYIKARRIYEFDKTVAPIRQHIETALAPITIEHSRLVGERAALEDAKKQHYLDNAKMLHSPRVTPAEVAAHKAYLNEQGRFDAEISKRAAEIETLIDRANTIIFDALKLPNSQRNKVRFEDMNKGGDFPITDANEVAILDRALAIFDKVDPSKPIHTIKTRWAKGNEGDGYVPPVKSTGPQKPNQPQGDYVHFTKGKTVDTVGHEATHYLETHHGIAEQSAIEFYEYRTTVQNQTQNVSIFFVDPFWKGGIYAVRAVHHGGMKYTIPFPENYMGREYVDPGVSRARATELLSVGVSGIAHDKGYSFYRKDSEYFDFLIGTTRGRQWTQPLTPNQKARLEWTDEPISAPFTPTTLKKAVSIGGTRPALNAPSAPGSKVAKQPKVTAPPLPVTDYDALEANQPEGYESRRGKDLTEQEYKSVHAWQAGDYYEVNGHLMNRFADDPTEAASAAKTYAKLAPHIDTAIAKSPAEEGLVLYRGIANDLADTFKNLSVGDISDVDPCFESWTLASGVGHGFAGVTGSKTHIVLRTVTQKGQNALYIGGKTPEDNEFEALLGRNQKWRVVAKTTGKYEGKRTIVIDLELAPEPGLTRNAPSTKPAPIQHKVLAIGLPYTAVIGNRTHTIAADGTVGPARGPVLGVRKVATAKKKYPAIDLAAPAAPVFPKGSIYSSGKKLSVTDLGKTPAVKQAEKPAATPAPQPVLDITKPIPKDDPRHVVLPPNKELDAKKEGGKLDTKGSEWASIYTDRETAKVTEEEWRAWQDMDNGMDTIVNFLLSRPEQYAKESKNWSPQFKALVDKGLDHDTPLMDSLIKKSSIAPNTVLTRGIMEESALAVYNKKVGDTFDANAFQSWTTDPRVATGYTGDRLEDEHGNVVPPVVLRTVHGDGKNARWLGNGLHEVILPRGMKWQIVQKTIQKVGGKTVMVVDVVAVKNSSLSQRT